MKRVQILLVAFVAVCLLAIIVIAFLVSKPDPKSYKYPVDALSDSINKFSFEFYNAVGDSKRDTNFVYSPLSLASVFGILLLGSRTKTERAIFEAFSFNESVPKPTKVRDAFEPLLDSLEDVSNYSMFVANKLILQQYFDVKSTFKREAKQKYKCAVDAFDFTRNPQKIIEKINKWVSEKTNGKIENLFNEPLSGETKMVILNAVYFHAKWLHLFNKSETVKNPFFNKLGEVQQVDFMKIKQHFMLYNHTEKGFTLLEVNYNGNVSFNVIFPNKFENDGLPNVMRNLTIDDVEVALNRSTKQEVSLLMPKFKFDTEFDLKNVSEKFGIGEIYNNSADFTGISASHNLRVSKGVHKAVIEVNEDGTEAAATTSIVIQGRSYRRIIDMNLNRPFAFFIRNTETRLIYFMGAAQHF